MNALSAIPRARLMPSPAEKAIWSATLLANIDRISAEMAGLIEDAKRHPVEIDDEGEKWLQSRLEALDTAKSALEEVLEYVNAPQ